MKIPHVGLLAIPPTLFVIWYFYHLFTKRGEERENFIKRIDGHVDVLLVVCLYGAIIAVLYAATQIRQLNPLAGLVNPLSEQMEDTLGKGKEEIVNKARKSGFLNLLFGV